MARATATSERISEIDGALLARMVRAGTARLRAHAQEVNDLNVFPIPDGDTGSNMLLTASGGADSITDTEDGIGHTARRISDGMLLSARGNSGVILSQIFEGMAQALDGADAALLQSVRPKFTVCCASSDRRYNSAHPETMRLLKESGAALYFSDCPPVDGQSIPPHRALEFTICADGAVSARYLP